jgi:hypothetical protein
MSTPAKGALIGAVGGGGIGAISSLFRKDKKHWMRDALTGMVAGGGAGLGAGALYDKISPLKATGGGGGDGTTPSTDVPPLKEPHPGAPATSGIAVPKGREFITWPVKQQEKAVSQLSWLDRHNLWQQINNEDVSLGSTENIHKILGFTTGAMENIAGGVVDAVIPDSGAGQIAAGGLTVMSGIEPIAGGVINIKHKITGQGRQWDVRPERLHAIEAATKGDKLPDANSQLKQHVTKAKAAAGGDGGLIDRALRGEGDAAQELVQHLQANPTSPTSKAFNELMEHVDGLEKLETGALNLSTKGLDYSTLEAMMARNRQAQGLPSGGTWFGKPRANMVPNPARGLKKLWQKVPGRQRGYGALAAALAAYGVMRGGKSYTAPEHGTRQQALDVIPRFPDQ